MQYQMMYRIQYSTRIGSLAQYQYPNPNLAPDAIPGVVPDAVPDSNWNQSSNGTQSILVP